MNDIKKTINIIYRKTANLNLYITVCNVKRARLLKEFADIKSYIVIAEKKLKRL